MHGIIDREGEGTRGVASASGEVGLLSSQGVCDLRLLYNAMKLIRGFRDYVVSERTDPDNPSTSLSALVSCGALSSLGCTHSFGTQRH